MKEVGTVGGSLYRVLSQSKAALAPPQFPLFTSVPNFLLK